MGLLPPLPPPLEYPASLLEWEEEMWDRRDRRLQGNCAFFALLTMALSTVLLSGVAQFELGLMQKKMQVNPKFNV